MKNAAFSRFFFFALLLLQSSSSFCTQAILWDLGGVLFKPNKLGMVYHEIGLKDIVWYSIRNLLTPNNIEHRVYDILYRLDGKQPNNPTHAIAYAPNGLELPQVMCDWLKGKKRPETIAQEIYTLIQKLEQEHFFVNAQEKTVLTKIIATIFDPVILAKYMVSTTQACPLLHEIKQHAECEQYILSNWDQHSFDQLYQSLHGQTIFNFFKRDHILISGECGFMKPNKKIFMHMLAKYNLNPTECILIDDQLENITAAQACGMQTIWFNNNMNFKKLRAQLCERGFLTQCCFGE